MVPIQSVRTKAARKTALALALFWMAQIGIGGSAWAGPSPLPMDPPVGTEAFISQTLSTQLRGVSDSGSLAFQNIGAPSGIEYNTIGYDPVTRYLYGVQVTGEGSNGGNLGVVRIGLDPADPTQTLVQPLGWPGYGTTNPTNPTNVREANK